jgi:beta-lactamase class A
MRRSLLLAVALATLAFVAVLPAAGKVSAATKRTPIPPTAAVPATAVSSATVLTTQFQHLAATAAGLTHNPMALTAQLEQLSVGSGGTLGVTIVELTGANPLVWSYNGTEVFTAASTYKLVALMMEAQGIAAGTTDPNGLVCYIADDYEAGWFDDYSDGACFTRNDLAWRAGIKSDNTAGHMLVRDVGGSDALNAWAAAHGAKASALYVGNTTTSNDLAALWVAEARGELGGAAAQAWLYPLLTGTATEGGISSGVGGGTTVVHKTGTIDLVENDAALVTSGPDGAYVLTVMTDGIGGDGGWHLIASVSSSVWQFEAARPKS